MRTVQANGVVVAAASLDFGLLEDYNAGAKALLKANADHTVTLAKYSEEELKTYLRLVHYTGWSPYGACVRACVRPERGGNQLSPVVAGQPPTRTHSRFCGKCPA